MVADPLTLSPEDSLMEALQMMRLRKIRRIPILTGDKLVGLLTEGDLKRAEPSTLSDTQEHFTAVMEGTLISQIMIENLITTTPDTPLLDAARALWTSKYGALPVLEGGKLVGILTDNDLIGALVKLLEREASAALPPDRVLESSDVPLISGTLPTLPMPDSKEAAKRRAASRDQRAGRVVKAWVLIAVVLLVILWLSGKLANRDINRGEPQVEER